uniref:Uncharacterized protein n=1 Tax=Zea mays TaxID=4577 RepID=C0PC98_MAIZE|nr:unknown [Zea mays]
MYSWYVCMVPRGTVPVAQPPNPSLAGDGRRVHGGAARRAGAAREAHRLRLHPRRHRRHHAPACPPRRLPLHPALHHPRRRHDGRQRHDRHRRHHEEAPGGRQDPEEPGGDGAGAGRDAAAGDAAAGEAVAGHRAVPGDRQRQDGGAHRAAGRHDGAHHGRRVAA